MFQKFPSGEFSGLRKFQLRNFPVPLTFSFDSLDALRTLLDLIKMAQLALLLCEIANSWHWSRLVGKNFRCRGAGMSKS